MNAVPPMPDEEWNDSSAVSLQDLPGILRRRWRVALATCFAGILMVVWWVLRITPMYEAHAVVTVDYGTKAVRLNGVVEADRIELNTLNTIRDQILSVTVFRDTIAASGLATSPAYLNAADPVEVLRSRVKATTSRDSLSIGISLTDEYPERAERALGQLIAAHQGQQAAAKGDQSDDAVSFLRTQRDEQLRRLDAARAEEVAYMNRAGIVSINPDSNSLTQRLAALNTQMVAVEGDIAAGRPTYDQVVKVLEAPPEAQTAGLLAIDAVVRDPAVTAQQHLVSYAQTQVGEIEGKYGEKHPRMIAAQTALQGELMHLREATQAAAAVIVGSQRRRIEQGSLLRTLIDEQEARLKQYLKSLQELRALSDVTLSHNQIYQTLLTRLNEAEIDRAMNERKVRVIDPPSVGTRPINLNMSLFLVLAIGLGVTLAVGSALLSEFVDTRVHDAAQVTRLTGLPLLGRVPRVNRLVPLSSNPDPEAYPTIAEGFRHVRAAVRLARRRPAGCERLGLVSSAAGEGTTTACLRLSLSLAAMGARVLVIDGDLRYGAMGEEVGLIPEAGLAQLLAGQAGIAPVPTQWENLDFLGAGPLPFNPGELLLSPLLPEMLQAFSPSYDYIIIDTPPLSLFADVLSVAEHLDSLLLVVREGEAEKEQLSHAMSRLAPVSGGLIGFILNGSSVAPDHDAVLRISQREAAIAEQPFGS